MSGARVTKALGNDAEPLVSPDETMGHLAHTGHHGAKGEPCLLRPEVLGDTLSAPPDPKGPRSLPPGGSVLAPLPSVTRRLLRAIASHADRLPILGMAVGLAVPVVPATLAPAAILFLAVSVFCSFMSADRSVAAGTEARRALATLPVIGLGSAAACWAATLALGGDAELAGWMALIGAAPVGATGVLYAGTFGLPSRPILLLTLFSTLAAPVVMPVAAWLFASKGGVSPLEVALRVGPAVLLPALLAMLLARVPALTDGRAMGRPDWRGVSTMALVALACSRMEGVVPMVAEAPWRAMQFGAMAVLAGAIGGMLLMLCRWPGGLPAALLAGGCRNSAMAWAVTAPILPPEGQFFMAVTLASNYGMPLLVRKLVQS